MSILLSIKCVPLHVSIYSLLIAESLIFEKNIEINVQESDEPNHHYLPPSIQLQGTLSWPRQTLSLQVLVTQ